MLQALTCGEGGANDLRKVLPVPEKQQPLLQAYHGAMCGGGQGQRSERFRLMSLQLGEQLDTQIVSEKVHQKCVTSKKRLVIRTAVVLPP